MTQNNHNDTILVGIEQCTEIHRQIAELERELAPRVRKAFKDMAEHTANIIEQAEETEFADAPVFVIDDTGWESRVAYASLVQSVNAANRICSRGSDSYQEIGVRDSLGGDGYMFWGTWPNFGGNHITDSATLPKWLVEEPLDSVLKRLADMAAAAEAEERAAKEALAKAKEDEERALYEQLKEKFGDS